MFKLDSKYTAVFYIGLGMVFLYAFLVFFGMLSLIVKVPLTSYTAPVSVLFFVLIYPFYLKWYSNIEYKKGIFIALESLLVFTVCLWSVSSLHETLFDAIWYHHDAVYNLAKGWNPYERYLNKEETAYCHYYLNHFPIGNWVYGASIYLFTHTIEAAKGISLAMIVASSFMLCGGMLEINFNWPKWKAVFIGLLVSLNPISLLNIGSFYVDGSLAILLSLGILFILVQIFGKDEKIWFPAMLVFALICHQKLTGTAYAAIFMFVFALLVIWKYKTSLRTWLFRFVMFVVIVVMGLGFHPFVSNTIDKGHPFFPAIENPEINVFGGNNYPANFIGLDRFEKFSIALYAEAGWIRTPDQTKMKAPFTFDGLGNYGNGIPDIGAFGPLFQEVFTLALLIFILGLIFVKDKQFKWFAIVFACVIAASFFVNREAYIFRYIPHFWLLTVFFASFLLEVKGWKWLSVLGLIALLFNVYRMEVKSLSAIREKTAQINSYLSTLKGNEDQYLIDTGWAPSFKNRLGENGIDTSKLVWISPTDTPYTEIPGSLGGKFKLRSALHQE